MQTITIEPPLISSLVVEATESTTPAGVQVSDVLLMRVGGLPLTAANQLKDAGIPLAIERSNELAAALERHADSLSVSLYEAINLAKGNAPLQHALLAVRRGVHNGRRLLDSDLLVSAPYFDEDTRDALAEWRRLKQELDAHALATELRIQHSLDDHRRALKRLAQTPSFRKGMLLSSPSFERALNEYVHSGERKPDKKMRRTERTLISYLLRTTHKTSPFSTLTPVSMVRLSDQAPRSSKLEIPASELQTSVRPNLGILARVAQALRQNAIQHPHLRLSVQSAAVVDGNRVKYWKRVETPVKMGGPVHTRVSENTFWIHRTPSLKVIMDRMAIQGTMSVAGIVQALTSSVGLPQSEALEYIRLLIDNGFLDVAGLRQSMFDPAYWTKVAGELAPDHDSTLALVADKIRVVLRIAAEFEFAAAPARPRLLQAIESEVTQVLELAGNEGPVPHPLLYEDSRVEGGALSIHRKAYETPLAALSELQWLLALFDPFLVTKASLNSLFKKRFGVGGTCSDLMGFSDYFHEVFYRPYVEATNGGKKASDQLNPFGRGTVNPLRLPEVSALQGIRAELLERLETQLQSAHSDEFEIPAEWVDRLRVDLRERHKTLSNSFFFQVTKRDGETVFVLNHVYAGFGCMFTRFMHLFESAGRDSLEEALRANLKALQPAGVLFAEMQGGHETNLNQHRLLTDVELVFPGERGTMDRDRRIDIEELTLRHDAVADEVYLYCDRLGKKIVPVYLGMLYPLVLPELQTMFLHFAPPSVLKSALSPKRLPEATEVLRQPRVRYKQVILERVRWTVQIGAMPIRASQEKDYEFLLRFARWRELEGIPAEVFALLIAPEPGHGTDAGSGGKNNGAIAGPQKPFYLDLDQPLFLLQLEKLAADNSGYVQFTECLPSPNDAILSHGDDRYVSEFVVDITQGHPL